MSRLPRDIVPWEKIGGETVLAERFGKRFVTQDFRNPRTGMIEEFALFGHHDWVVVLAVTTDGLVITNHEYKQGCDRILHELPAGKIEPDDEDPAARMRIELREEAGYEADQVTFLGPPMFMSTRSSWTRFHPYLALNCREVGEQDLDESEDIARELIPLERWIALCLNEVVVPSAIVATFRALSHLGYSFIPPA